MPAVVLMIAWRPVHICVTAVVIAGRPVHIHVIAVVFMIAGRPMHIRVTAEDNTKSGYWWEHDGTRDHGVERSKGMNVSETHNPCVSLISDSRFKCVCESCK